MKLLTVGDSFTYGEELADLKSAWPFILSDKIGYEVTNLAKPGAGNTRMVRYVIENAKEFNLVIIAWSHFARWEWADQKGYYDIWPGCNPAPYESMAPWRKYLIDHITWNYNDNYLYRQYLINIILLQNYLKANNIQYLMLDSFGNHQHKERKNLSNKDLVNQIDLSYYIGWPQESMMEWTHGTPQGPNRHFLEQGHIQVAEIVFNHIKELGWVN